MNQERLVELIDELIAGDITAENHSRLQQHLKSDAAARQVFRERIDLEAGLRTLANESSEAATSTPQLSHHRKSKLGTSGSEPKQRRFLIAVAIAASILIAISFPVGRAWISRYRRDVADDSAAGSVENQPVTTYVGALQQQGDCEWREPRVVNAHKLALGTLALRKGVARLSFDSGTDIILEGPCEIEINSAATACLLSGSVFVDVTELSNGFTLSTPESRIVDEGTEYAVSVEEMSTEVHVFDGSVVWIPNRAEEHSNGEVEHRIEAGEARSYQRAEPTRPLFIPFGRRQFVRSLEQQVRRSAGGALIAYDGFENLAGRLRRGRSGVGWSGGWQAGGTGRGPLATVVDSPDEVVFGFDRQGRRQLSLEHGLDIRRVFERPISLEEDGDLFLSVLVTRGSQQTFDGDDGLKFSLEPDLPGRGRRLHQLVSFGIAEDDYPFINRGGAITRTAALLASAETYLMVLKLTNQSGSITPSLRVYRAGESVDASEPTVWTVQGEEGSTDYDAASIRITAGELSTWQLDELKLGRTWESVTNMRNVE